MGRRRSSQLPWRFGGAVALTAVVLWLVLRHQESGLGELWSQWARMSPASMWQPLGLSGLALLLAALRWKVVLAGLGERVPMRSCLYAMLAAWPPSAIVPSRATDLLRPVLLPGSVSRTDGLASVVAEKAFDLQSLMILAGIGAWISGLWPIVALTALGLLAFWASYLTLARAGRPEPTSGWRGRITSFSAALARLRRSPAHLVALIGLSLLGWTLSVVILQSLLRATGGTPLAWRTVLALWPVAIAVGALPLTISGLGTRDAALVYLLELTRVGGVDATEVLAATLLYPVVTNYVFAILGLPLLVHAVRTQAFPWIGSVDRAKEERPDGRT